MVNAAAMRGTERAHRLEAQAHEIGRIVIVFRVVGLVHAKNDRLALLPQQLRHDLIHRMDAVQRIHHEQNRIRRGDGDLRLRADHSRKVVIQFRANAAGVYDADGERGVLHWRSQPVARDPRHVMHDGNAVPRETVEEGGLPHIRPAHDGNEAMISAKAFSHVSVCGKQSRGPVPPQAQMMN